MSEKWVEDVEEVVANMSGSDIGYFSDSVWCGNKDVEAWFFSDGTCLISRDSGVQKIWTKDAEAFLVEQPPEDLFRVKKGRVS